MPYTCTPKYIPPNIPRYLVLLSPQAIWGRGLFASNKSDLNFTVRSLYPFPT